MSSGFASVLFAALVFGAFVTGCSSECVIDIPDGEDLVRARDLARMARKRGVKGRIVLRLLRGRHELRQAVRLDGNDSDVLWCADPGAEVRVSGGLLVDVEPERVVDPDMLSLLSESVRDKVVQYDLERLPISDYGDFLYNFEDAIQRRQACQWAQGEFIMGSHPPPKGFGSAGRMELFVDDRPMTVARSATGVVYHIERTLDKTVLVQNDGPVSPEGRFVCREELPAKWSLEPDPFVCGCWCHDWAEQHQRIERIDLSAKVLELSKPYHQYNYRKGSPFYGFNMLCELDEPGEWYVHRTKRKLVTYLPGSGRSRHRLELSMSGRLFELHSATNVVFRGLVLETCRNSAVWMGNSVDCALENCTVRNVGHHALIVEDGRHCGARGCRMYGMGGGGVWLSDYHRADLKWSEHFVEDCDIHDFGRWNRMYRPGVCLSGVGMKAERNRIHDAPHAAILFFGCNLLLRSNEVYRVCRESLDCGALYTGRSWDLRGNRIYGNHFHDIIGLNGKMTRTVYLDDAMAEVDIAGNLFERCTYGIFIGGSRENVVTNNVFIDCPGALYVDRRGMGWLKGGISSRLADLAKNGKIRGISYVDGPYVNEFPAMKGIERRQPFEPAENVIKGNEFIRGNAEWIKRYAPKSIDDPLWWRAGDVKNEELAELGVFENNEVK